MIETLLSAFGGLVSPLISGYIIHSYISSFWDFIWTYGWAGIAAGLALLWAAVLPYKKEALLVALACGAFAAGGVEGTYYEHTRMKHQIQALQDELDKVRASAVDDIAHADPNSVRSDPYNRDNRNGM